MSTEEQATRTNQNQNPKPNPNSHLKMVCGSFYIPKKNLKKPQGEDAYFIYADRETIGMADGVGGWSRYGIDAGEYARQLMHNSAIAVLCHNPPPSASTTSSPNIDPRKVLREAFAATKLPGSSTACIVTHRGGVVRTVNVGDSGFMLFRGGQLLYQSPAQQRCFNFPYQLGDAAKSERPDRATETELSVRAGDVIVLGTDGLLDNVFAHEIEKILGGSGGRLSAEGQVLEKVEKLAVVIAKLALKNSSAKTGLSPFSKAANLAGFSKHNGGGKVDDITVIVAEFVGST